MGTIVGGVYSTQFGGLCGYNVGTISACYATGTVVGGSNSNRLGSLCGLNEGSISGCYATGTVVGGSSSSSLGGLCGNNTGTISSCYATGPVVGGDNSMNLGGLCGVNYGGTIQECYATGTVKGGVLSNGLSGLCGKNEQGGTISGCFWDIQTSGQTASAGGTGKTTAEMKRQLTFTAAGWDFTNVWGIDENRGYPYLWVFWQPASADLNGDERVDLADFALFAEQWMR